MNSFTFHLEGLILYYIEIQKKKSRVKHTLYLPGTTHDREIYEILYAFMTERYLVYLKHYKNKYRNVRGSLSKYFRIYFLLLVILYMNELHF